MLKCRFKIRCVNYFLSNLGNWTRTNVEEGVYWVCYIVQAVGAGEVNTSGLQHDL